MTATELRDKIVEAMAMGAYNKYALIEDGKRQAWDDLPATVRARYRMEQHGALRALERLCADPANGVKLTTRKATDEMASEGTDQEVREIVARLAWTAMHDAAKPTPWSEE